MVQIILYFRCGNQGCSRYRNNHALKHHETPHSDSHALCINTSNWMVWCYECDNDINPSARKKLQEAVKMLKVLAEGNRKKQMVTPFLSLEDKVGVCGGGFKYTNHVAVKS